MWVAGKLREEACECVVVHQQGRRRNVERGGDRREPVNGDRTPAVLVVDKRVTRPVEPRGQLGLRKAGAAPGGGDTPPDGARECVAITAHRTRGTAVALRSVARHSALYMPA